MKKFIIVTLMLVGMSMTSFAQSAQVLHLTRSAKIFDGERTLEPGYYNGYKSNGKIYVVVDQGDEDVIKGNCEIVTWTAAQGHGFIIGGRDRIGNLNVRKSPSTSAPVVTKIKGNKDAEGYPDDEYECLGVSGNWYKIKANGKIGYIRNDLVEWNIHSIYAAGEIR